MNTSVLTTTSGIIFFTSMIALLIRVVLLRNTINNPGTTTRTTTSTTSTTNNNSVNATNDDDCNHDTMQVPFFFIPSTSSSLPLSLSSTGVDVDVKPPFLTLNKVLHKYQENVELSITSMTLNVEIARKTEWTVFPNHTYGNINDNNNNNNNDNNNDNNMLYSSQLEKRMQRTAELLEANYFVLEQLLKPFDIVLGLPTSTGNNTSTDENENENDDELGSSDDLNSINDESSSSYDSAMQVLTHIIRDWSPLGKRIRISLYSWIIDQLLDDNVNANNDNDNVNVNVNGPILVPGAGLGRLAYDISKKGFHVEANEISIVMSAVANQFLHQKVKGDIYPFVNDYLINEINSEYRYEKVNYPDNDDHEHEHEHDNNDYDHRHGQKTNQNTKRSSSSLSYTIGDFIQIYSTTERRAKYSSIVTCFFIDTASNIYEYLLVIRNVLMDGGTWINVGPLQWHGNSKLNPSGDELRLLIQSMGFTIHSWTIDDEAINYRHDDMNEPSRYTKYEGYKPLRFVASIEASSRISLGLDQVNVKNQIINIRKSIAPKTFRKYASNTFEFNDDERPSTNSNIVIEELS